MSTINVLAVELSITSQVLVKLVLITTIVHQKASNKNNDNILQEVIHNELKLWTSNFSIHTVSSLLQKKRTKHLIHKNL